MLYLFDKDIILLGVLAVHGIDKRLSGELVALVGVDDVRFVL